MRGDFDWLRDLDPEARSELLAGASERKVDRNATILAGEDFVTSIRQVTHGRVRQFIVDENGNEVLLHVYRDGDILGDSLGLDGEPYPLWLTAATDVTLREWPIDRFDRLRGRHRAIDAAVAAQTTRRLRHALTLLAERVTLDSAGRVAARLHWLVEMAEVEGSVDLIRSQDDVATMADVSRQTVNRVLADLEVEGAVEVGYGRILVKDVGALRRFKDRHRRRP